MVLLVHESNFVKSVFAPSVPGRNLIPFLPFSDRQWIILVQVITDYSVFFLLKIIF